MSSLLKYPTWNRIWATSFIRLYIGQKLFHTMNVNYQGWVQVLFFVLGQVQVLFEMYLAKYKYNFDQVQVQSIKYQVLFGQVQTKYQVLFI